MKILPRTMRQTVTILTATSANSEYGTPGEPQWDDPGNPPTSRIVKRCSLQPIPGSEYQIGQREAIITRWRLKTPPDSGVKATDRVQYGDDVYEVDGDVEVWDTANPKHIEAVLKKVSG